MVQPGIPSTVAAAKPRPNPENDAVAPPLVVVAAPPPSREPPPPPKENPEVAPNEKPDDAVLVAAVAVESVMKMKPVTVQIQKIKQKSAGKKMSIS